MNKVLKFLREEFINRNVLSSFLIVAGLCVLIPSIPIWQWLIGILIFQAGLDCRFKMKPSKDDLE